MKKPKNGPKTRRPAGPSPHPPNDGDTEGRLNLALRLAGPSPHPPNDGDTEGRLNLALRLTCDAADSTRTFQCHGDHVDLVSLTGTAEVCDVSRRHHRHQNYQRSCSLFLDINRKLFSRNYRTKPCTTSHLQICRLQSIFTFVSQLGPQPLAFLVHQPQNF